MRQQDDSLNHNMHDVLVIPLILHNKTLTLLSLVLFSAAERGFQIRAWITFCWDWGMTKVHSKDAVHGLVEWTQ